MLKPRSELSKRVIISHVISDHTICMTAIARASLVSEYLAARSNPGTGIHALSATHPEPSQPAPSPYAGRFGQAGANTAGIAPAGMDVRRITFGDSRTWLGRRKLRQHRRSDHDHRSNSGRRSTLRCAHEGHSVGTPSRREQPCRSGLLSTRPQRLIVADQRPQLSLPRNTKVHCTIDQLRRRDHLRCRTTSISPGYVHTGLIDNAVDDPTVRAQTVQDMADLGIDPTAVARAIAFAIDQPDDVEIGDLPFDLPGRGDDDPQSGQRIVIPHGRTIRSALCRNRAFPCRIHAETRPPWNSLLMASTAWSGLPSLGVTSKVTVPSHPLLVMTLFR